MDTVLLIILILDGLLLTAVVLLQSGQGGGLASMGGGMATDNVIGGRQAVTLLTKMTWITGGLFLGLALVLSVLSSRNTSGGSILRDSFGNPTTTAPAPTPNAPAALPGTQPAPAGDQTAPQTPPAPTTNN